MSLRRRMQSSSPPPTAHTRPPHAVRRPVRNLALYLCCAAEVIFGFADAIGSMPWTRLVESVVCQRHASGSTTTTGGAMVAESGNRPSFDRMLLSILLIGGRGGPTAEARCKGDAVQAEMAELMGGMFSLGSIPGLFLVIPFSMLAKHIDRRLLLITNAVSLLCGNLFMIIMVLIPNMNLKFLWLAGLFSLFGGGGPIFSTLLRSIIAESVKHDQLSSVLYVLSGLSMLVRLGGVVLGSWLLQYGAGAANLSGVALMSVAIPILGLLPPSVARAPRSTKSSRSEQRKPMQQDIGLQHLTPKSISDSSTEAEAEEDTAHEDLHCHSEHRNYRQKSFMAAVREADLAGTVQNYTYLPIRNPLCFMFLAIMFINSLAMGVRDQLKTWISTRYGWPLADVGYVLGGESVAGVVTLFALPWLDRVWCHAPSVSLAVWEKRKRELRVAQASLGLGAAGALVVALAAERAVFVLGLVVMMGAVGFPDAVRAFCTSFFAADEIQALYAAVTVVEMLGVIIGSPVWGWIFAQAYHGGSFWIGMPFGICMVLLLCTLGLVLRLKP